MAVLGALIFAVYPISVARAHDIYGGENTVAVSAGLLFACSVGASVSPMLASFVMSMLNNPFGLFGFWCALHFVFILLIVYLRKQEKVETVPVEDQVSFVPMKSTSPVVMAMDPRSESKKVQNTRQRQDLQIKLHLR